MCSIIIGDAVGMNYVGMSSSPAITSLNLLDDRFRWADEDEYSAQH